MTKKREAKKVFIVTGIPGVGKTSVIEAMLKKAEKVISEPIEMVNYGTVMLEVAKGENLVNSRDELRILPPQVQRRIQRIAGEKISKMAEDKIVIVDTHTLIITPDGYLVGLPEWVVTALEPHSIILVEADPNEIARRRSKDDTRERDKEFLNGIKEHQDLCRVAGIVCATLTGSIVKVIENRDGEVEQAAMNLLKMFEE